MKKSEAIKIIEEVLRNPYDYPATTILMKLEDAGMLPPVTNEKCSDPEISITKEYFDEYVPNRFVIGWEDETDS